MTMLTLSGLNVVRNGVPVLSSIDLTLGKGEVVGLIGPNGAGKTTLMRAAQGLVPAKGESTLARLRPEERARRVAWLPQDRELAWPVTVEVVVALGRLSGLARPTASDRIAVDRAIARMGLETLRHRKATELSGGERARALIARMLAQETPLLLADEPVAGLDPAAQIATMEVFSALAAEGRGVLVSLHDLGLAARHCTRLVLMDAGRIVADGTPQAVLTPDNLARVFGIRALFETGPHGPVFQALERVR